MLLKKGPIGFKILCVAVGDSSRITLMEGGMT